MKQDIRLIAMDLDGTALNSKKELTGRTRDAIEQAVKQGIHVVVATGRNIFFSGTCCLELKELSCAITSNGAVINQIPGWTDSACGLSVRRGCVEDHENGRDRKGGYGSLYRRERLYRTGLL